MHEINNFIILTQQEYDKYEEKARTIIKQRDDRKTLNMQLRFPYYIPEVEDVEKHLDLPIKDVLPYYIYLTMLDDDGKYMVEPDDEILNETRDYMKQIYEPRICIVENEKEERKLVEKYNLSDE